MEPCIIFLEGISPVILLFLLTMCCVWFSGSHVRLFVTYCQYVTCQRDCCIVEYGTFTFSGFSNWYSSQYIELSLDCVFYQCKWKYFNNSYFTTFSKYFTLAIFSAWVIPLITFRVAIARARKLCGKIPVRWSCHSLTISDSYRTLNFVKKVRLWCFVVVVVVFQIPEDWY